jgi:hypothetical protein
VASNGFLLHRTALDWETVAVAELVWVSDWEVQCCGVPFGVGDQVDWRLSRGDDTTLLETVAGPVGRDVTSFYDHHSQDDSPPAPCRLLIREISAVYCRYAQRSRSPVRTPAAGSARIESRRSVNGWEPDRDGLRFVGYLVSAEHMTERVD